MKTGSAIKTLLAIRGLTIKELAEKTGISVNTLYSITKRDTGNIYSDNLQKILKALECSVSEFEDAEASIVNFEKVEEFTRNDPNYEKNLDAEIRGRIEHILSSEEFSLLEFYWKLNPTGQAEALQRIYELGVIDKYRL